MAKKTVAAAKKIKKKPIKKTKAKAKRKLPSTAWKKGKSANPKGRPRGAVRWEEIQKAFNHDFLEIQKTFKKYWDLPEWEFNRTIDKVNKEQKKGKGKMPMGDLMAIKYIGEALKKGHASKLTVITDVITGTYGGGIKDVVDYELEDADMLQEIIEFSKSAENREMYNVNSSDLLHFVMKKGGMHPQKAKIITTAAKLKLRGELSKLQMVEIQRVQLLLTKLGELMKDTLGRTNPRLLADMTMRMYDELSDVWKMPQTIEVPARVEEVLSERKTKPKRGRPKKKKE